ncbi:gluconokinase [Dyella lutea]|uniref:Gluconokinase n=1 Tax=Dyella lutea TaxID=2950441 RepID=A0ABT1F5U9_9GAMM|nr:gluconokinase, GntK/IdnK-type [Dyella lutea]MCP1372762.1 gluconokinase, GntK/IdnK-type [Dyella lutea]
MRDAAPLALVVMGVSGSGKSHVGAALAAALGAQFLDADDLHPEANLHKMAAGTPLDDCDRMPWLDAVAAWIGAGRARGEAGVVACSALRRRYRDRLRAAAPDLGFVHLAVPRDELARRMRERRHFMPPSLLDSQLATLEPPAADEDACTLDGTRPMDENIARVRAWLSTRAAAKG